MAMPIMQTIHKPHGSSRFAQKADVYEPTKVGNTAVHSATNVNLFAKEVKFNIHCLIEGVFEQARKVLSIIQAVPVGARNIT